MPLLLSPRNVIGGVGAFRSTFGQWRFPPETTTEAVWTVPALGEHPVGGWVLAFGRHHAGHAGDESTTTELCPPMPSDDLTVIPPVTGVGPLSSWGWPGATVGGAGMVPRS